MKHSYSISHFSWLPQAVYKELINRLSQKVSYVYMQIDPVIDEVSPNGLISGFHIYDHSIVTFGIRGFYLGFSKTSHAESLDRFRKLVVHRVKLDISVLKIILKKII